MSSRRYGFHRELLSLHQQAQGKLNAVEDNPHVKLYGEAARRPQRQDAILTFGELAGRVVRDILDERFAAAMHSQAQEMERARANIRAGRPPDAAGSPAAPPIRTSAYASEESRALAAVAQQLSTVAAHSALSNALQLTQVQETPAIAARLQAYAEAAQNGDRFGYRSYAIDRAIIPAILGRRAGGGDNLAQYALGDLDRAEAALLKRAFPDQLDASVREDLSKAEQLITRIDAPHAEDTWSELSEWLSFVARTIEHEDLATAAVSIPAPIAETEFDVLAHIAAPITSGAAPAAAVAAE